MSDNAVSAQQTAVKRHHTDEARPAADGLERRVAATGCGWCSGPTTPRGRGPLPEWCSATCRHRPWECTIGASAMLVDGRARLRGGACWTADPLRRHHFRVEPVIKSLGMPDEVIRLAGITEDLVDVGDLTVGRVVQEPGWRWSTHVRPVVGGRWCQARHVGVVLTGRMGFLMESGREYQAGPYDVYDIPPGHDGFTVGDEAAVLLEWSGLRSLAGRQRVGASNRVVATLLFTDLVDSTALAVALGDVAWRERLSEHLEAARAAVDRFGGREVETTGDGILATFGAPALALPCAAEIHRRAAHAGLRVRAGVHVGEVDVVGDAVRGVAVHEAARIMALAEAGQILASEIARNLAGASGFTFEDRGVHVLKGLPGEWRLFAYRLDAGNSGPVGSSRVE